MGGMTMAGASAQSAPSQPPCPRSGVPAATRGRQGQPGEGGTALGHTGGSGPQKQGAQRGGGCCPSPRSMVGGSRRGFPCPLPAPTTLLTHPVPTQVLQQLEARRQQVPEVEAAAVERQMEEARENIRKAEVSPPGRRLWVASRSVTPRVGDAGMGRCGGWGCSAGGASPSWQPHWGPGAMELAGLSPHPIDVPLDVDNVCVSPGQPSEGRGTAGAAAGSRAGRGHLAGRGYGGGGRGGAHRAGSG